MHRIRKARWTLSLLVKASLCDPNPEKRSRSLPTRPWKQPEGQKVLQRRAAIAKRQFFRSAAKKKKWSGAGSNRRHMDFQSIALPTELPDRNHAGPTGTDHDWRRRDINLSQSELSIEAPLFSKIVKHRDFIALSLSIPLRYSPRPEK